MEGSTWEKFVALTVSLGERLLLPIERFIGRAKIARRVNGSILGFVAERLETEVDERRARARIGLEIQHVVDDDGNDCSVDVNAMTAEHRSRRGASRG